MIEIFKEFLELERPLNEGIVKKLESNLKTNFIYNSNAIEGSTLTLKETDIIFQYGVTIKGKSLKEHEEVKGQEYALNFFKEVIKTNESLSLRLIRTGRLLLNLELMKNGYPITVIRNEDRDEYYTVLETAQVESNYNLLADFIEKSVENTFWMYYKYFDEDTKMKFEEYLKKNGINPKEVYQKRFEGYPETERDFPKDWYK